MKYGVGRPPQQNRSRPPLPRPYWSTNRPSRARSAQPSVQCPAASSCSSIEQLGRHLPAEGAAVRRRPRGRTVRTWAFTPPALFCRRHSGQHPRQDICAVSLEACLRRRGTRVGLDPSPHHMFPAVPALEPFSLPHRAIPHESRAVWLEFWPRARYRRVRTALEIDGVAAGDFRTPASPARFRRARGRCGRSWLDRPSGARRRARTCRRAGCRPAAGTCRAFPRRRQSSGNPVDRRAA